MTRGMKDLHPNHSIKSIDLLLHILALTTSQDFTSLKKQNKTKGERKEVATARCNRDREWAKKKARERERSKEETSRRGGAREEQHNESITSPNSVIAFSISP